MKRWALLVSALVLAIATAGFGANALIHSANFRYRVTAYVSVGDRTYVGESVWQLEMRRTSFDLSGPGFREVRGEAIRIEVPEGPDFFIARRDLRTSSNRQYGAFPLRCLREVTSIDEQIDEVRKFQGPCLVGQEVPALVRFTDESDPSSIEIFNYTIIPNADPQLSPQVMAKPCDDVCILSILVERTTDPITISLAESLPWLRNGQNMSLLGTDSRAGATWTGGGSPGLLFNQDFSTEIER